MVQDDTGVEAVRIRRKKETGKVCGLYCNQMYCICYDSKISVHSHMIKIHVIWNEEGDITSRQKCCNKIISVKPISIVIHYK